MHTCMMGLSLDTSFFKIGSADHARLKPRDIQFRGENGRRHDPIIKTRVLRCQLQPCVGVSCSVPIFCAYNCFHEFPPMGSRKVTSLLSSERARTATRSGVMLSKAPTFEGYILACIVRVCFLCEGGCRRLIMSCRSRSGSVPLLVAAATSAAYSWSLKVIW